VRNGMLMAIALVTTVSGTAIADPGPAPRPSPMRIFIAGDSTAQDYKADRYPQSGWGTMLRCAVAANVSVENRAIGGRSTNSFIREGRLDTIAADLRKGDTLLIQFGHNDASVDKPERFTSIDQYEANLRRFLAVATHAGAKAVILTPVARRDFKDGVEQPSFPTYAEAARRVAAEGWRIGNLDSTVIAQAPKLAPHIPAMRERIAAVLGIVPSQVNVKAKTAEKLGPVGEGRAMEARAVVLLQRRGAPA